MQGTDTRITISDAEYEVMRVVWANISVTSREIIDVLKRKMDWNESTIKTLIGRLVDKELLNTEKDGRRYIYTANVSEQRTMKQNVEHLFSLVCDTHDSLVVKHVLNQANLSVADIQELIGELEERLEDAPKSIPCACVPGQCDCHLIG